MYKLNILYIILVAIILFAIIITFQSDIARILYSKHEQFQECTTPQIIFTDYIMNV